MINRVALYFTKKVLQQKGMKICPLCDDEVIGLNTTACYFCEQSASWGFEVKV